MINSRSTLLIVIVVVAGVIAAGCSRNGDSRVPVGPLGASQVSHLQSEPSTLSREHRVVIDVPETELEQRFHRLADRCTADAAHHCTILQSDLASGQFPSGFIKLRIDPGAVEDMITFASSLGRLEHRSTMVEDLADAMQDTQSRIAMLTNYRKQLLDLQAKAATNVDAAVRIASELSKVQSDLERATGDAAYQAKRTTTDILKITFAVSEQKAFWHPVHEAARDFLGNLSNGMSQAITAVAYIVPWLFVVIPGLYLVRFLWRRRGR